MIRITRPITIIVIVVMAVDTRLATPAKCRMFITIRFTNDATNSEKSRTLILLKAECMKMLRESGRNMNSS